MSTECTQDAHERDNLVKVFYVVSIDFSKIPRWFMQVQGDQTWTVEYFWESE